MFGEPPLPTVVELAGALRDLTDTVQSLERSSPELEALVQTVRDAQQQLAAQAPTDLRPRVGDDPAPDRRVYVDHGYARRRLQPVLPAVHARARPRLTTTPARHGTVEFPISYEGPPGLVHGGFLAVFFDCVLQELNCALGLAGKTAELSRPVPATHAVAHAARRTGPSGSSTTAASPGTPSCSWATNCCARRTCSQPRATAPRCPADVAAPPMSTTVSRVLRAHVAERPDAEFVVCDDDRLTYADAERRSRVLARGLLAAGAGRGSRIGLLFPTGVDFVLAWLATARIGAIAVPISTFSTSRELRDLLARADVDLLLGVREYRGNDYVGRARRRGRVARRSAGRAPDRGAAPPGRVARRLRHARGARRRRARRGCSTRSRTTSRPTTAWSSCTRRGRPARRRV